MLEVPNKRLVHAAAGGLLAFATLAGLLALPVFERAKYALWTLWITRRAGSGSLRRVEVAAPSLGRNVRRECWLYLPPGWQPDGNRRYPVVMLLHGSPGAPIDWLFKGEADLVVGRLIDAGTLPSCIVAIPDGRGTGPKGSSLYLDAPRGGPTGRIETWIVDDLVRYLVDDCRADSDPSLWIVAGNSEGGFGAASLVCRHPSNFGVALALSGFYRANVSEPAVEALLGPDKQVLRHYSPYWSAASLPPGARCSFVLGVGDSDRWDKGATQEFGRRLGQLGIDRTIATWPGGHTWEFWREGIERLLPVAARRWSLPPGPVHTTKESHRA